MHIQLMIEAIHGILSRYRAFKTNAFLELPELLHSLKCDICRMLCTSVKPTQGNT